MINLAPLYYLNIMESQGGPISEVKTAKTNIDFYTQGYKTLVKLRSDLIDRRSNLIIYTDCDGTGSDQYQKISFYKAVSEAIERWSYFCVKDSGEHGFRVDKTTNGMAAFPSLFKRSARKNALYEAFERWAILHWWHGFVDCSNVESFDFGKVVYISHSNDNLVAAIVFSECPNNKYAFGFAASNTKSNAFKKSLIELKRNYDILSAVDDEKEFKIKTFGGLTERRLLYFSSTTGYEHFIDRTLSRLSSNSIKPNLVVDEKIDGPWSQYAMVWRCLFYNEVEENMERDDVFIF